MKKITTTILSFYLGFTIAQAQEVTSSTAQEIIPAVKVGNNIQVKFGGFLRAEYYIDSREIVGAVDDLFGFFPENKRLDENGDDLNAVVRQNLSTQATRFNALFTGPDIFNARSSAFFEYDFSGGGTVNLRLRHAWAKLNWDKAEVLVGKTWNPFAETPFPSVAGLHTGIPFRPFGRGDQVRITYKPAPKINILFAGVYQTEHKSTLEQSAASDIRANPIPDFHLQFHYKTPSFSAGFLSEFKVVKPATQTTGTGGTFKTSETLPSYALAAYADYKKNLFNVKSSVVYGQNLSELFQQGGYAVKSQNDETGARTYTPSNSVSYWINLTYGKTWVPGIFAGYQKNLGFNDNPLEGGDFFGRWQNVDHIYRIAPSLKYSYKQWTFQAEIDYNVAAYGRVDYADKGKVKDAKEVSGVRGILATTFFF
jgi:hypothetical protein